jgi:beta-aspartyl-peptidase (threonine type)
MVRNSFTGMSKTFSLAVHGGAGTIAREVLHSEGGVVYLNALHRALEAGYRILQSGGEAIDAVQAAVVELEDAPCFNAGRGSVFNSAGEHEMDAAIMNGANLQAGAVAALKQVRNPVLLAREIMRSSEHVLLVGEGAETFAQLRGLRFEPASYFRTEQRFLQWQSLAGTTNTQLDHHDKKHGTVGAVARDAQGNLAAATSTGGITNKQFGRVGDSPIIGCGTYANNSSCAVSCTGHGEFFIRAVVAYDVAALVAYRGLSLEEAVASVVHDKLKTLGGEGGLIAVDPNGSVVMDYNSVGMYRGSCNSSGKFSCLIFDEVLKEGSL